MRREKCAYLIIGFVTFTYRAAIVMANEFDMARIRDQWSDMESGIFT